jgi:hypothetical protein
MELMDLHGGHLERAALIAAFLVLNAVQERSYRRRHIDPRGALPISRRLLVLGKASMIPGWLGIVVQSYVADLRVVDGGPAIAWLAMGVEAVGVCVIAVGYRHLGDGNQIGLTRGPIRLRSTGEYHMSRNPVYSDTRRVRPETHCSALSAPVGPSPPRSELHARVDVVHLRVLA